MAKEDVFPPDTGINLIRNGEDRHGWAMFEPKSPNNEGASPEQQDSIATIYLVENGVTRTTIVLARVDKASPELVVLPIKASYISSRMVNGKSIVYGSVLHTIDEIARSVYRVHHILEGLPGATTLGEKPVDEKLIPGMIPEVWALPEEVGVDMVPYDQEVALKDALLLVALHVRTLLEDFSGVGNVLVSVYGRKDNIVGRVSLAEIVHTLAHYRYCVVSGGFVHDIFSIKGHPGSGQPVESKIRTNEIFRAVHESVTKIRIRDFVGVLRGKLERLLDHPQRRDVISAVQNTQVIEQIVSERPNTNGTVPEFVQFLASRMTTGERRTMSPTEFPGISASHWMRRYGIPNFQIGHILQDKTIQVDFAFGVTGDREVITLGWDEFFSALVRAHGDEPLVFPEVHGHRMSALGSLAW